MGNKPTLNPPLSGRGRKEDYEIVSPLIRGDLEGF